MAKELKKEDKKQGFLNFLKPSWLKFLFFIIYFLPVLIPVATIFNNFLFYIFLFLKINILIQFIVLIVLNIITSYLVSCFIISAYKKKESKTFFRVMLWIGIILTLLLISVSLLFVYGMRNALG
jgi:hypothetical protein